MASPVSPLSGVSGVAAPARPSQAMDRSRLEKILMGQAKPADEREALQAAASIMWKKAFEGALKPMEGQEPDSLSAPQAESIRERQATWMGIEAATALSASIGDQLAHVQSQGSSAKIAPK